MPMSPPLIVWADGSNTERLLARIASRVRKALRRADEQIMHLSENEFLTAAKIKSGAVQIELPPSKVFHDTYTAKNASSGELRKILSHDLTRISPITEGASVIAAISGANASLLHVRSETLQAINNKASELNLVRVMLTSAHQPNQALPTPATIKQAGREHKAGLIAFLALLAGACALISVLNMRTSDRLEALEKNEQLLRARLLEKRTHERELSALGTFAQLKPQTMSPQAILARMEILTKATPKSSWWNEFRLTAGTAKITGRSDNAGTVLSALSESIPDMHAQFDSSVSDTQDGQQAYIIRLDPRERTND